MLATFLGTQCIWLLLAEFVRPSAIRLPTDPQHAGIIAEHRNAATSAAWIGVIRGDLWAESAFTYANLLWTDSTNNSELAHLVDRGHARLDRAVLYAPIRLAPGSSSRGLRHVIDGPNPMRRKP